MTDWTQQAAFLAELHGQEACKHNYDVMHPVPRRDGKQSKRLCTLSRWEDASIVINGKEPTRGKDSTCKGGWGWECKTETSELKIPGVEGLLTKCSIVFSSGRYSCISATGMQESYALRRTTGWPALSDGRAGTRIWDSTLLPAQWTWGKSLNIF